MGIKRNELGNYVAIAPSRFTKDYYDRFQIKRIHPKIPFPFLLDLTEEATKKVSIDYKNESDFLLVDRFLSKLERKILIIIATFRNIQKYQLQRELTTNISGKRLDKALKKLYHYFLIDAWNFSRQDKTNKSAIAYSINQNGYQFIIYHQLIEQKKIYQWEQLSDIDAYQPIRFWKIVDAYQMMKVSAHYKDFYPQTIFPPQPYTLVQQNETQKFLDSEHSKQSGKTIFLKHLKMNGEILFQNPRLAYIFDLYPIVTEVDISNLQLALQHWSVLGANDNYRYLLVVVDSWEVVTEIDKRYRISDYSPNILFLDLERVQYEGLTNSLYQFDNASSSYEVLPFKLLE